MRTQDAGVALPPDLAAAVEELVRLCPDQVLAVVFFGSRLLGTSPSQYSAADAFFVVEDYHRFYTLARSAIGGWPLMMAALNRVLPPNIVYLPGAAASGGVKAFIISARHFHRAMSLRAKDHFCLGRLSQRVGSHHRAGKAQFPLIWPTGTTVIDSSLHGPTVAIVLLATTGTFCLEGPTRHRDCRAGAIGDRANALAYIDPCGAVPCFSTGQRMGDFVTHRIDHLIFVVASNEQGRQLNPFGGVVAQPQRLFAAVKAKRPAALD